MINKELNIIRDNMTLLISLNNSIFDNWKDDQASYFQKEFLHPSISELNFFLKESTRLSNELDKIDRQSDDIINDARNTMGELLNEV